MWLITAWNWLKKYWVWLLFPIGILLFVVGRLTRKDLLDVVAPEVVGAEEERRKAQEAADKKAFEAELERQRELDLVREKHDELIQDLTDEQREKAKELESDPKKLNEFLLDVGRTVRG